MLKFLMTAGVLLPLLVSAEIVLLEPAADKIVPLVPQNQKELIAMSSHAARKERLASERDKGKNYGLFAKNNLWRRALSVTFSWKCTAGETGPFTVVFSETPDFQNAKYCFSHKAEKITPRNYELNFKVGQKYYWKVMTKQAASKVSAFTTEAHPPRWIAIEGTTWNIRDLGGWKTTDGDIVRQGRLFRGAALNYTSVDGKHRGRKMITAEDTTLFCDELGIRTDLDLRGKSETGDMTESPMGKNVKYIQISTSAYTGIFSERGKKTLVADFKVLADPKNHPIYFHCVGGYDRTGALAFIANGVLGVSENDLASDWEQTSLPLLPDLPPVPQNQKWRDYDGMVKGFQQYGKPGDPLKLCIEKYLLSGGVTPEEIATFRNVMLVK